MPPYKRPTEAVDFSVVEKHIADADVTIWCSSSPGGPASSVRASRLLVSMFSPVLRRLIGSSEEDKEVSLIMPDFSFNVVSALVGLMGKTSTATCSAEEVSQVTEASLLLEMPFSFETGQLGDHDPQTDISDSREDKSAVRRSRKQKLVNRLGISQTPKPTEVETLSEEVPLHPDQGALSRLRQTRRKQKLSKRIGCEDVDDFALNVEGTIEDFSFIGKTCPECKKSVGYRVTGHEEEVMNSDHAEGCPIKKENSAGTDLEDVSSNPSYEAVADEPKNVNPNEHCRKAVKIGILRKTVGCEVDPIGKSSSDQPVVTPVTNSSDQVTDSDVGDPKLSEEDEAKFLEVTKLLGRQNGHFFNMTGAILISGFRGVCKLDVSKGFQCKSDVSTFQMAAKHLQDLVGIAEVHGRPLSVPESTNTVRTPFSCPICKYQTKNEDLGMLAHYLTHIYEAHEDVKKCTHCEKEFDSVVDYFEHFTINCGVEKQCEKCLKNIRWVIRGRVNRHMHKIDHDDGCELRKNATATETKCHVCSVTIKGRAAMRNHLASKHNVMVSARNSKYVTKDKDGNVKWKKTCPHCGETMTNYVTYLRKHADGQCEDVVCDMCGKTIAGKGQLKIHVKIVHENLYSWQCGFCQKKFKSSGHVERHVYLHSKEAKPWKCTWCEETFRVASTAKTHCVRAHGTSDVRVVKQETEETKEWKKYITKIEPEKDAKPRYQRYTKKET